MKKIVLKLVCFCVLCTALISCSSTRNTTDNVCKCQLLMNSKGSEFTNLLRRQAVLGFVENFRTAYNRKDIDLLSKVYSDDALITTAKEGKQTKKKYFKYLRSVFKNNTKINVVFDNIEVVQCPDCDGIYGVRLKQGWNTTNYSNVGSLFLLVDFKDGENMQIFESDWQPEKLEQVK